MILNYLSAIWPTIAPALGNHLWQSTLFAVSAGLLTLALRKNHARVRYALWLAASLKFFIPFALLVGLGGHLSWSRSPAPLHGGLYVAMQEVSQPFNRTTMSRTARPASATTTASLEHLLPTLIATAWLCGFLVVLFVGYVRWRRISATVREAAPTTAGREVEALRHLEHIAGIRKPLELRLSSTSLEPGIFGITRPVLLWPKGISDRLEDPHLDAILTHELWHVLRRDNLVAAVHMLVEVVFWFHPLVWWLGSRLVEERERACDEAVLESSGDRKAYAESILKICEFCVASPLTCVAGVTGADLKKRILHIMTQGMARNLDLSRKLMLSVAGLLVVVAPIAFGMGHATQRSAESQAENKSANGPLFEVTSITLNKAGTAALKTGNGIISQRLSIFPGIFTAKNISMWELIRLAYRVEDYQVSEAPDWFSSELYDVDAKAGKSAIEEMQKLGNGQRELENQRMLQALLESHFKLEVRQVTEDLPIYSLGVAEAGKLHEAQGDCGPEPHTMKLGASLPPPCGSLRVFPWVGRMDGLKVSITDLVANLSGFTKRMVLDNTNLVGKYDISLTWFPGQNELPPRPAYLPLTYQPDPSSPPLLTAIQQQLGLKLESQTGRVPLLVIDHVEKPTTQAQPSDSQRPDFGSSASPSPMTQAGVVDLSAGSDSTGTSKTQKSQNSGVHAVYWSLGIFYAPNPQGGQTTIVLNKVFSTEDSRYDAPKLKNEFKSWILAQHSDWVDEYPHLTVVASGFANRQGADNARERRSKRSLDDELVVVEWTPSKPF
jgi:bla regulator protein BlaR1